MNTQNMINANLNHFCIKIDFKTYTNIYFANIPCCLRLSSLLLIRQKPCFAAMITDIQHQRKMDNEPT